jgi:O-antigen/teichoic acid export membrane protein
MKYTEPAVSERVDLQARVDRGAAWIGFASLILGGFDLVSTLATLWLWVSPADFGAATLAIALFPILDRVAGIGLGAAVVRRLDAGPEVTSSIFWLGLATSLTTLLVLLVGRTHLGAFFPHPIVASLLCAYAGKLVFQNVYVVPEAILRRDLRYRALSLVRISASFVDTTTKLGAAYLGAHGIPELKIWCFVIGPLANAAVTALGMQLSHPWRPRLVFHWREARAAAKFGLTVASAELLYFVYTSVDYVVVGRVFGDAAVGVYRLAYELVLDVTRLVSMVTAEIAFPAFVRLRGDRPASAAMFLRFTRQNLIVLAPFLAFVLVAADELLAVLYPPLDPAVATAVRILCVVGGLRTLSFVIPPVLAGLGEAGRALAYNVVAAIVLPAAFVAAAHLRPDLGYLSVAWAWAIGYPIAFAALVALTLPRLGLPLPTYLRAVVGVVACAAVAGAVGYGLRPLLPPSPLLRVGACAAIILAIDVGLLARFLAITPRSMWRAVRGGAPVDEA